MNTWIILVIMFGWAILCGSAFLYFMNYKIQRFERHLIALFLSRTDTLPAIYEISSAHISRHKEIFAEVLDLRKQEFSLSEISNSLEGFMNLEGRIHHEINFIFQVCNKNPKLLKTKEFLYCRDNIMQKSSRISLCLQKYRKIIKTYNQLLRYKNYSVIWLALPFTKKPAL